MKMIFTMEDEWLRAVAAMVREGVTFLAYRETEPTSSKNWVIEFTGGY